MKGGDLHWIWKPYELYQEIDYVRLFFSVSRYWKYETMLQVYGLPALERGDGFPNAQCTHHMERDLDQRLRLLTINFAALLNLVETIFNLLYVYLAHVSQWPGASVLGFASVVMTLSKTVLYWLQEYYCGFCAVGHNTIKDLIFLWIIPNGCVPCLLHVVTSTYESLVVCSIR